MALIKCAECGNEVSDKASACPKCGCPIEHQEENVIYRKEFIGKSIVICPKCKSKDCRYHQETEKLDAIKKTRYTANINPLKPFTIMNKKEKVIIPERTITKIKFQCNKCGYIFK